MKEHLIKAFDIRKKKIENWCFKLRVNLLNIIKYCALVFFLGVTFVIMNTLEKQVGS